MTAYKQQISTQALHSVCKFKTVWNKLIDENFNWFREDVDIQYYGHAICSITSRDRRELVLKDSGVCTMQNRRTFHKLLELFSIINHQSPSYLENCLPNFFYCASEQFCLSFLPYSVSLWNKLPVNIRSCTVLASFKTKLLKFLCVKTKVLMQFYIGDRTDQINLCQIRLNFSSLNDHLYTKSCIESPSCSCSAVPETPQHYFFDCLNYQDQRQELFSSITNFLSPDYPLSLKLLLRGSPDLTVNNNVFLTTEVLKFIHNSARFM